MCLDIWWNWEDLKWPNRKFPSLPAPTDKATQPNNPPYQETRSSSCLSPSSGSHFPASPRNYLNKPITSFMGTRGTPPSWYSKAAFHDPWLFALFLSTPPCGLEWRVLSSSPRLGVYVTHKTGVYLSCPVLAALITLGGNPALTSTPSTNEMNRSDRNSPSLQTIFSRMFVEQTTWEGRYGVPLWSRGQANLLPLKRVESFKS